MSESVHLVVNLFSVMLYGEESRSLTKAALIVWRKKLRICEKTEERLRREKWGLRSKNYVSLQLIIRVENPATIDRKTPKSLYGSAVNRNGRNGPE